MKNIPLLSKTEFSLFQDFLVKESGLYFEEDRNHSLHLAIFERMQKNNIHSYQEYYNFLTSYPEGNTELREILDMITTGETYFFRNMAQFKVLIETVLPEIIQDKMHLKDKFIRIWSAGCSKGDEVYSIAIALMETLPSYKDWNISILGTDINRNSLISAKEAIYNSRDIRRMPEKYLDKYFEQKRGLYYLIESVKQIPRFEYHNLAKGPYTLDGMQYLDIIFCRNVTIYFDLETTKRIINNFYDCLNMGGKIFLGHAETLWGMTDKYKTIEFPQTFIYKKGPKTSEEEQIGPSIPTPTIDLENLVSADLLISEEPAPESILPQPQAALSLGAEVKNKKSELEFLYFLGAKLVNQGSYEQALDFFDKIILRDSRFMPAYFGKATIFSNQAKYQDAISALEEILKVDNLCVEAYCLMGALLLRVHDLKNAEEKFRKALYIDPSIALAYYNLGNIYIYMKKYDKAILEFKNAIKILDKKDESEHIRFCEDFTVEFLLKACKNNIARITKLI